MGGGMPGAPVIKQEVDVKQEAPPLNPMGPAPVPPASRVAAAAAAGSKQYTAVQLAQVKAMQASLKVQAQANPSNQVLQQQLATLNLAVKHIMAQHQQYLQQQEQAGGGTAAAGNE
ncbi:hypothetical protein HYH03_015026 [Edaphochlamys debaryana]|uniref:Uncharacterized protein n=1 Tax=Edaphochlamys debaryana TaxID=47281 RepID=A0A835XN06_9CHLO|nr:hypothetical protein HYH03_015026 [Edaphochlamys debaryana]|eukprot:KAG2486322.1 hypothetical protein HYH03_015026 [Edaphochlamys debaryana]